ncbi:Polymerase/histidinol phosphatase-like protein [Boeremia exigua]|uniref:Polymerase/histidinol phosphatase-like protein n=1 Tax=Boeremia exigua TaxID=749465 RepID=UPI001E8EEAE6|nr:Polymerase/histidinol phosphatase-like protein [Boeremia exigua]KAH6611966.1 Polymerase/histidinol phosphatase-like protein [Boeremia exigua]
MPHSHHSHSGQFCGHATNKLEDVIQAAIAKGFHSFALTEHIPRELIDFYPEETDSHTEESLVQLFDDYYAEAVRLRDKYAHQIQILIAFESEWIRPSSLKIVQGILDKYTFDFFMGSIHHTHTVPIDFDRAMYEQARDKAGGTDEQLFEDYFDEQYDMLQALRPPIVGHFDLIRLLSDNRDTAFEGMDGVWNKMKRNLEYIAGYGGLLEFNSAGLRKGLLEPYPCLPVTKMFSNMGGGFVLSDDSHGIEQIGTNYSRLLEYVQKTGVDKVYFAARGSGNRIDSRFPNAGYPSIAVAELAGLPFWSKLPEEVSRTTR